MLEKKRAAVALSIAQVTTGYVFGGGDVSLPKLQLHSPPVRKNGRGFIVNTWWTERERETGISQIDQEGQLQSRLQRCS